METTGRNGLRGEGRKLQVRQVVNYARLGEDTGRNVALDACYDSLGSMGYAFLASGHDPLFVLARQYFSVSVLQCSHRTHDSSFLG